MTTLAEDSQSWKASGVIRRDFRSARDLPETPKTRGSRKDTRHWCKGVVGREHVIEVKEITPYTDWKCDYCTICGKVLRWHERTLPWGIYVGRKL